MLAPEDQKEQVYLQYQQQLQYHPDTIACNLYLSAFLTPKCRATATIVPTTNDIDKFLFHPEKVNTTAEHLYAQTVHTCQQYQVLHWPLAFPEQFSFSGNGFDCVLCQPPLSFPKIGDKKWLVAQIPELIQAPAGLSSRKILSALTQSRLGCELLQLEATPEHQKQEQEICRKYAQEKHKAAVFNNFINLPAAAHGRFPLTAGHKAPLYAYFVELAACLRQGQGSAGLIVPAEILSEYSTMELCHALFKGQVKALYHFRPSRRLWSDARHPGSFVLMTLHQTKRTDVVLHITALQELDHPERHQQPGATALKKLIHTTFPNSRTKLRARQRRR